MNKILATVVLALGVSTGAQASLTSSGPLTVYDSAQNLTWTKDANLSGTTMDWSRAVAWAANLNYAGYTDWVLPTKAQLATQFSTNLGEAEGSSISSSHNASYDLFTNVQSSVYWSGTGFAPDHDGAWVFDSNSGFQYNDGTNGPFYVWAVRPGAVPVPGAIWLFGSGLVWLMGFKGRGNIG
ncbi:MAG: DUF1566 domain-containing protein [Methylococcaceae bacterium]